MNIKRNCQSLIVYLLYSTNYISNANRPIEDSGKSEEHKHKHKNKNTTIIQTEPPSLLDEAVTVFNQTFETVIPTTDTPTLNPQVETVISTTDTPTLKPHKNHSKHKALPTIAPSPSRHKPVVTPSPTKAPPKHKAIHITVKNTTFHFSNIPTIHPIFNTTDTVVETPASEEVIVEDVAVDDFVTEEIIFENETAAYYADDDYYEYPNEEAKGDSQVMDDYEVQTEEESQHYDPETEEIILFDDDTADDNSFLEIDDIDDYDSHGDDVTEGVYDIDKNDVTEGYESPEQEGMADSYMESQEEAHEAKEEKEIETGAYYLAGILLLVLPLSLCSYIMIKNNPTGLCASLCRLLYAIVECFFKILFLPCRLICCRGNMQNRNAGYATDIDTPPVATNEEDFDDFNPDFSQASGPVPVMT